LSREYVRVTNGGSPVEKKDGRKQGENPSRKVDRQTWMNIHPYGVYTYSIE
jgi:hypothetical protein